MFVAKCCNLYLDMFLIAARSVIESVDIEAKTCARFLTNLCTLQKVSSPASVVRSIKLTAFNNQPAWCSFLRALSKV